ncbi:MULTISPECIES: tyrosine-protein phosphatase [Micromonospora]|uniref:tyrosine-protein phosphatase n=1 Tax=Micromonospora TaxID=1873 RepID=UPI0001C448CC|nr:MULTISPECIES: tyrosine-protein phosphatase [Micromonospora]ADU10571.1 protein tyrosine/serine phosphatase [Micromonospora sp. L5]SCL25362.1 protein-tyrosine phosphatase [Micromonospora aurantiaca]
MITRGATADATTGGSGVRNLRDAGGVGSLRRGVLYRSGALHLLTPEGARELEDLGLRTVIDLRSIREVADRPDRCAGLDVEHCHFPVFTDQSWPDDQVALYPYMAEQAGRATVAIIRQLITPGALPALVHCASGKDRTGVVVAVIQTLLNASDAEVTQDFLRSNAALDLTGSPAGAAIGHGTRPVTAAHLLHAMVWIRSHHGSVSAYLQAAGATEAELEALRGVLA